MSVDAFVVLAVHARLTFLQKQDIRNSHLAKYNRQHELDQFDLLWKKEEFYGQVMVEDFPFSTEMRSRYQKRYALDLNEESDNAIDDDFFADEDDDIVATPSKRGKASGKASTKASTKASSSDSDDSDDAEQGDYDEAAAEAEANEGIISDPEAEEASSAAEEDHGIQNRDTIILSDKESSLLEYDAE